MAAAFRRLFQTLGKTSTKSSKVILGDTSFHNANTMNSRKIWLFGCAAGFGSFIAVKSFMRYKGQNDENGFPHYISLFPEVQADSRDKIVSIVL